MEFPRRLGKYEILERIGVGGMAEVFRARKVKDPKPVKFYAIKQLLGHYARDPLIVSMFVDEARLAAQLRHPSIVSLVEFGTSETGQVYMVMEYVDGKDLRWCLSAAASAQYWLPIEFALSVVSSVCDGLEYAHRARSFDGHPLNLVHRDVSHSNIFLSKDGKSRLADFGIARAEGRKSKTQTGLVKGKLGYLSPEQVRADVLDARSDVFSAGVVLWELITQRRMFVATTEFRTMVAVCTEPRVPPSQHRVGIPPELDALCLKAVEINKTDRFQSAAEFKEAILALSRHLGYTISQTIVSDVMQYLSAAGSEQVTPPPVLAAEYISTIKECDSEETTVPPSVQPRSSTPQPQTSALSDFDTEQSSDSFISIDWMEPEDEFKPDMHPEDENTVFDAVDLLASRVPNPNLDDEPHALIPSEVERIASVQSIDEGDTIFIEHNQSHIVECVNFESLLKSLSPTSSDDIRLSTDKNNWMPLNHYNLLTHNEYGSFGHDISRPIDSGEQQGYGLLGPLCELALNGFTGRIIIDRPSKRYVLLLEAGGIVGLSSSLPQDHIMTSLAAAQQIKGPSGIMDSLREVISKKIPLGEVLENRFEINETDYHSFRSACAQELFGELLVSGLSKYSYEPTDGWPGLQYLAGNCMQWVLPKAERVWNNVELSHRLEPSLNKNYSLMPGLPLVFRMLRIKRDSAVVIKRLTISKTMNEVLSSFKDNPSVYSTALRLLTILKATNAITFAGK
ncbi:MAG: serine/threonine-protein kinase [Myxococcota bacterium]|nr:serine/threonine-protein kinase [Myxococcota bacterium]